MTDQEVKDYPKLVEFLYMRAQEVQPHLHTLAMDLKACGLSDEDIAIELLFAMLHEGYRLRCLTEEIKLASNERRLQTHIPEENKTTEKPPE